MDNKTTIIIAVVAVVIIAAVAAFVVMNNNGGGSEPTDDDKEYFIDTQLRVFGNADNNDYLDKADLTFIKNIADGKEKWHSSLNPLADANVDGKVDSKDYDLVQAFLDGKEGTMYSLIGTTRRVLSTTPSPGSSPTEESTPDSVPVSTGWSFTDFTTRSR